MKSFWQVSMKSQAKVLDLVQSKPIQEPGLSVIFVFFLIITCPFMCLPQQHIPSPIYFSKTASHLSASAKHHMT
ncbi:rCG48136, isoform CRA_a [Rattus norvegicus]|uniref:RCG48136, isoform CRA_a n=1 Tax=Rattus norvegicus TaxID=10116 RepID=A6HY83_RAT|nr:rCG48136, isoform CRA_a [Rattus norvegicus]